MDITPLEYEVQDFVYLDHSCVPRDYDSVWTIAK